MEVNLTEDYLPEQPEDSKIREVYSRLQIWQQRVDPDLDTRPGSVYSDHFLMPAAKLLAALEEGIDLFTEDLDLENLAEGNITNCDFAARYLKNFGVTDTTGLQSSGLVRFVRSVDEGIELDRGLTLKYNNATYLIRTFGNDPIRILPVGSARETNNDYVLTQTSPTRYYADLPVESYDLTEVPNGSTLTLSKKLDFSGVYAVGDFYTTEFNGSIPALAKKTRTTFHAATMGTKAGAVHTIKREFPDLLSVSPVIQGQPELTRAYANQFGVALPCCDIYVKSPFYGSSFKQVVRLDYKNGTFFGKVEFSSIPLSVIQVNPTDEDDVPLPYTLYTRTKNSETYPRLSSAFSDKADYWIEITPPEEEIELATDENGVSYQYFEVVYYTEPMVSVVSRWLNSEDNKPIGVDFNVRAFDPFVFDSLDLRIRRNRGTRIDEEPLKKEISDYMLSLSYPDVYTDAAIGDALFNVGVSQLKAIDCNATLRVSPATKYIDDDTAVTYEELTNVNILLDIPTFAINTSSQFTTEYIDDSEISESLYYGAGEVNTGFILDETKINLIEQ